MVCMCVCAHRLLKTICVMKQAPVLLLLYIMILAINVIDGQDISNELCFVSKTFNQLYIHYLQDRVWHVSNRGL